MSAEAGPGAPADEPAADEPPADAAAVDALVRRLRAAGCVFAEEEAALVLEQAARTGGGADEVDRLATARESGLPLEQVLGWAELAGVRVVVEPGVFVPRRRTELMVAEAVALVRAAARDHRPAVLLDLCCGSGAVAAAVLHGLGAGAPRAEVTGVEVTGVEVTGLEVTGVEVNTVEVAAVEVTAADVDPAAVRVARRNLPGARVLRSDLFADLPHDLRGRVDVLTANVPYVPTASLALMPREAREHEPRRALDGGADGLAVLRLVAAAAPTWLAPGGALLVETSEAQRPAAVDAFADAGLATDVLVDDDLGAVVVRGRRAGRRPVGARDADGRLDG